MNTHNMRLGSMLSFDKEKEKDIIEMMEKLNASHKTGQFLSNLIRIAFDTPEILNKKLGKYEKGDALKQLDNIGASANRQKFFNQASKELRSMKDKVDSIYKMALKTYTLALTGKHIGLEEKSDNLLLSTFIIERQLKQLQDTLGLETLDEVYASNKKENVHELADEVLEYIIESYDSILNQIKININQIQPIQTVESTKTIKENKEVVEENNETTTNTTVVSDTLANKDNNNGGSSKNHQENDDEIIDFGEADMSALTSFFDL